MPAGVRPKWLEIGAIHKLKTAHRHKGQKARVVEIRKHFWQHFAKDDKVFILHFWRVKMKCLKRRRRITAPPKLLKPKLLKTGPKRCRHCNRKLRDMPSALSGRMSA